MREGVYWVMLFIHVAICASLSFFVCADSLPEEEKSGPSQPVDSENDTSTPLRKLDLARDYFRRGYPQHSIVILDVKNRGFIGSGGPLDLLRREHLLTEEDLRQLSENSRNERAQIFLYLGYSYLHLGNESEAYKNFINAFRLDPDVDRDSKALQYDYLKGVIREAQIAAQMVTLDLFVFVDISKSISKLQVERIKELQYAVNRELKPKDHVTFYPFGDMSSPLPLPFPISKPSSALIVENLRTADSTDFAKLFKKLIKSLEGHEGTVKDPTRQTAILIISDGEHSVPTDKGGGRARIPQTVSNEFKNFLDVYEDIPIVIITVDRVGKKGSDYAARWTQALTDHPVGRSFYYNSESELKDTLRQIFDTIASHRSKMFVIRDPKADNQSFFFNDDVGTVKLLIQYPLQEARLKVTGTPNWTVDRELFSYEWEKTVNPEKNIFTFTNPRDSSNNVNITCHDLDQAVPPFQPPEPLILTLTFHQLPKQGVTPNERLLGEIKLRFEKQKPMLQITKEFGRRFILRSNKNMSLEFQGKIKPSYSLFKQLIPLKVTTSENDCFTINGTTMNPTTAIVSIDISSQRGYKEFTLPIVAEGVDKFTDKKSDEGVTINFQAGHSGAEYHIDNQVGKTDFRVVSGMFYWLYRANEYIWWPIVGIFGLALLYPCWSRLYTITDPITTHRGEGFKVFGNTIYDSKGREVLRIQRWWFPKIKVAEGILKTANLRWSSDEDIDLLSKESRIQPRRTYQIILSKDGEAESTFNIAKNYALKTSWKVGRWFLKAVALLGAVLASVWIYVYFSGSQLLIISCFLGFLFLVWMVFKLAHYKRDRRIHSVGSLISSLIGFSRGVGFLDAFISLITNFFHIF